MVVDGRWRSFCGFLRPSSGSRYVRVDMRRSVLYLSLSLPPPRTPLEMSTNDPVMRLAYSGEESRLVIAIDVGTTFSGASYTILQPNQVPKIYSVSR